LHASQHASAQIQDEATEVLFIDVTNLMTLADETRNMPFDRAQKTFRVFINGMGDNPANMTNPLYINNYTKRVMRIVMAYVALKGICPSGNLYPGHVIIAVLEEELGVLEGIAQNPKDKKNGYISKEIKAQLNLYKDGEQLSKKKYGRVIYEY
jgi:hypothetical protein